MQYKIGTVSVTNGSAVVTGSGTAWLANVPVGSVFTVAGSGVPYVVGAVGSDTSLTLSAPYAGATNSGLSYAITTSFTPNHGLPYPEQTDIDTHTIVKRSMLKIDGLLGNAIGAAAQATRIVFTDASGNLKTSANLTTTGTVTDFRGDASVGAKVVITDTGGGATPRLELQTSAVSGGNIRNWLITTNYDVVGDFTLRESNAEGGDPYGAGTTRFKITRGGGRAQFGAAASQVLLSTPDVNSEIALSASTGGVSTSGVISVAGSGHANTGAIRYNAGTLGHHQFDTAGVSQVRIVHTASAVNYAQLSGASTGNEPYFGALGTDTNIGLLYFTKGSGGHRFFTAASTAEQVRITHTANAARYVILSGADAVNFPFVDTSAGALNLKSAGSSAIMTVDGPNGTAYVRSGNLFGVGVDGPSYKLHVKKDADTATAAVFVNNIAATATNQYGILTTLSGDPNNTINYFFQGVGNATERFTARTNGGVANFSANNVNLSDETTKIMLGAGPDYSQFVEALDYQRFFMADQLGRGEIVGVTAQRVALQDGGADLVTAFGNGKMGIYTHQLQERINSVVPKLLTRVRALEQARPAGLMTEAALVTSGELDPLLSLVATKHVRARLADGSVVKLAVVQ